jgi:hypothetical protein
MAFPSMPAGLFQTRCTAFIQAVHVRKIGNFHRTGVKGRPTVVISTRHDTIWCLHHDGLHRVGAHGSELVAQKGCRGIRLDYMTPSLEPLAAKHDQKSVENVKHERDTVHTHIAQ